MLAEWQPPPEMQGLPITKVTVGWLRAFPHESVEMAEKRSDDEKRLLQLETFSGSALADPSNSTAARGVEQDTVRDTWQTATFDADARQHFISPLEAGMPYLVRIRGTNRNGPGDWNTMSIVAGRQLPGPPQLSLSEAKPDAFAIVWDNVVDEATTEAVLYYQVRCFDQKSSSAVRSPASTADEGELMMQQAIVVAETEQNTEGGVGVFHVTAESAEWTAVGLQPSTTYAVQMCACTKRGSLGWSRPLCITTAA